MKLDIFTMKDLKWYLTNEFDNVLIIEWDKVAKKVMEWVEKRQAKESEEQVDKWFECLSVGQKADNADIMWDNLSLEDKKEIANLE